MRSTNVHGQTMIHLSKSLLARNSPRFDDVFKQEIGQLGAGQIPLQQGLSSSSYALDDKFDLMIISVADEPDFIQVNVGIFYCGILAGCNCADDPTPVEPQSEYCEVRVSINKATAETTSFAALIANERVDPLIGTVVKLGRQRTEGLKAGDPCAGFRSLAPRTLLAHHRRLAGWRHGHGKRPGWIVMARSKASPMNC